MLNFTPENPQVSVFNPEVIPKEMDIFYRNEYAFLPAGKTFAELTPEEAKLLENQYRFDPMRPGEYQGVTGFRNSA